MNHRAIYLQHLDRGDERGIRAVRAYARACERNGELYQEPGGGSQDLWRYAGQVFVSAGTHAVCRLDSEDRATCLPPEDVPEPLHKAIRNHWGLEK